MKNQSDVLTFRTLPADLEAERKLQLLANDIEMALVNIFPDSSNFMENINFVYEIAALFTEAGLPFYLYQGEARTAERKKGVPERVEGCEWLEYKVVLERVEGHEWLEVPTRFGTIIIDPTLRCELMDVWEEGVDFDLPAVLTTKQAEAIARGYGGDAQRLDDYIFCNNWDDAERALPDVKSLVGQYANVLGRSVAA